jgi:adenylate kinase family enzyme
VRVVIVGSYGAGKTTLARRLGAITGIPVHHLDATRWDAGWVLRSRESWLRELDAVLAGGSWIVEGNFERTLARRLAACDMAVFLDFPTHVSARRVLRRRISRRPRIDLPDGLTERPNLRLVGLLLDYRRRGRPAIATLLERYAAQIRVVTLRDAREVEGFVASVERSAAQRPPTENDNRRQT